MPILIAALDGYIVSAIVAGILLIILDAIWGDLT
jgi:hypothetical protein